MQAGFEMIEVCEISVLRSHEILRYVGEAADL